MAERRRHSDENGRYMDLSETPLGGLLPEGAYNMKIAGIEERYSQDKGVLMYVMELRVMEPESMLGRGHYELMVFGTTPFNAEHSQNPEFIAYSKLNDPDAEDPLTLKMSRGVQMFKQLLYYANVDTSGIVYMPEMIDLCNSGELMVGVRLRQEEQKGGQYAGTIRNRIAHVFEVGREKVGVGTLATTNNRRGARQRAEAAGPRRRSPQPENMERALANEKTREQLRQDMGSEADTDVGEDGQLSMEPPPPPPSPDLAEAPILVPDTNERD